MGLILHHDGIWVCIQTLPANTYDEREAHGASGLKERPETNKSTSEEHFSQSVFEVDCAVRTKETHYLHCHGVWAGSLQQF